VVCSAMVLRGIAYGSMSSPQSRPTRPDIVDAEWRDVEPVQAKSRPPRPMSIRRRMGCAIAGAAALYVGALSLGLWAQGGSALFLGSAGMIAWLGVILLWSALKGQA
jgi:hypothetical protein